MEKVQEAPTLTAYPPDKVYEAKPHQIKASNGETQMGLIGAGSFSTYFTWRGSGSVKLNCGNGNIRSNSRVFVAISEYNTEPTVNRFIGAASMSVFNVSPYNGGVVVWINVNWGSPLNIRLDVLVDP